MGDDLDACNVEAQRKDERSLLALYRRLIEFRRTEPALRAGSYESAQRRRGPGLLPLPRPPQDLRRAQLRRRRGGRRASRRRSDTPLDASRPAEQVRGLERTPSPSRGDYPRDWRTAK